MYINGRNAVIEALRADEDGRIEKIFVMYGSEGEPLNTLQALAKRRGVPCVVADRQRFADLERQAGLGTRSQGVIAITRQIEYTDIEAVVEQVFARAESPLIVALDGVTDPRNYGAVIRSAECAGLHGLLSAARESAGLTDVAIKASAGAASHLPVGRVPHLYDVLISLKQSGLCVVGLDERGAENYTAYDYTVPTCIVIGSEGEGLSKRIRSVCDRFVRIPMHGQIASLNASVAAGVVFFEAARQRQKVAGAA